VKRLSIAFAGFACASVAVAALAQAGSGHAQFGAWGIDLAGMDTSVKPGDDFFDYANGKWFAAAVVPADRTSTGSFQDLQILSEKRMGEIVAGLEAKPRDQLSDEERKLRDFYDAFTDTTQIEKRGLAPVKKDLARLATLKTLADVARAMGDPARPADSLFGDSVNANAKNSNEYVTIVSQSGLGMPDRDYYLKDDPALAATREAYRKYLVTMLTLAGAKHADTRADAVYKLETDVAKAHWPVADRRNADKTYNPMTVAQLDTFAPGFPWDVYFSAQGISAKGPKGDRIVILRENTAFPAMAKVFAATPVAVWRDWLTVHYLHNMSAYLPKRFDDADFAFYGQTLGGQAQQLPRETRGVRQLDLVLDHSDQELPRRSR